jgi:hypothetical protein
MRPAQAGIRPGPGLDLILRPSIRVRWGGGLFVLVALGHAAGQWLQGSLPRAAAILAATAIASVSLWRWLSPGKALSAQRLLAGPDGSLCLVTGDGRSWEVTLMPGSMRLGPYLLLVLRTAHCRHRLLLGPDNVDPANLAALRRRLRRPPAALVLLR